MQPLQLYRLFTNWGLERDPSLLRLWPRLKARDPIVLALLGRWALLLLVCMPAVTFAIAGLLEAFGFAIRWDVVTRGVAFGVAAGVAAGMARGVAGGVAVGVTSGVLTSVTSAVTVGVTSNVAVGVMVGVMVGVAAGVASSASFGVASGLAVRSAVVAAVGGAAVVVLGVVSGVAASAAFGMEISLGFALGFINTTFRLPSYPFETLASLIIGWRARLHPEHATQFVRWLPFRHHDLIYLPLSGLSSFFLNLAESNPRLAKDLLVEAAASVGQKGIAHRTQIELQARDLEKAARNRLFARVADLDLPFLPPVDALEENSPIRFFRSAARDLGVRVTDHRQRRLALERARRSLDGFIAAHTTSNSSSELSHRLLSTARLWLDIVQDEERQLDADEARNPQVPRAYIAGSPLRPEDPGSETLFKGRTDLAQFVDHDLDPDRRGVLVIVGQRRMGKSSFSNWLPRLLGTGTEVLVSNFQGLSGEPHRATPHRLLLDLVAAHLPNAPPPPASSYWSEALHWLRARETTLADRRLLVVIDEVERVQDGISAGWCSTDFLDFLRAAGDSLRRIRFLLLTGYPLHRIGPSWVDR
ncbi:MAG TPA: hypothetical protein VEY88_03170, partial [Archangium sp.]|nr:hypothetical protein [Archangium sp.]